MAFKKFGQIESINVKYNKERKKPYAFINFTDEESTQRAIEEMNDQDYAIIFGNEYSESEDDRRLNVIQVEDKITRKQK